MRMLGRCLPKILLLSLSLILAGQVVELSGPARASEAADRDPAVGDIKAEQSLEAAAAALYTASTNLLSHRLDEGVQGAILLPYCNGPDAPETDSNPTACTTFKNDGMPGK